MLVMGMSSKKHQIPAIRFKGFTDAWEQRKLGDDKDVRDGTHDSPKYHQEGHPLVTSKNLNDYGLDMTDVSLISDADFEAINKRSKVDNGDILFGMIGTIGNPVIVDRSDFAIKNVALIKEGGDIPNRFLIQLLKSSVFEKYIRNENAGNTQKFLGLSKIREFTFFTPTTEEQIRIATFFKQLDDTIALHQRKLTLFNQLKETYLKQMFPQNEENMPVLRFADFSEPWEQRKLGDTVQITMGQSPNGENYTDNPRDHILVQGNADMKNGRVCPRVWTTQVTKKADPEDIILSVRAPVGDVGRTDYTVVLGRGVAGIKGNAFIFQTLSRMKEQGFWTRYSSGSTFESINSADLKDAFIQICHIEEQTKIGDFFTKLDDTIALHQSKLQKLAELKKTLLAKMLV